MPSVVLVHTAPSPLATRPEVTVFNDGDDNGDDDDEDDDVTSPLTSVTVNCLSTLQNEVTGEVVAVVPEMDSVTTECPGQYPIDVLRGRTAAVGGTAMNGMVLASMWNGIW